MAEIDTTSIESVQAAISFFGEKDDQKKLRFISKDASHELDKKKETENLMKDMENLRVELEAKDSAHKKALLEVDHYQKTADELSTLLKNSEIEKDALINDSKESRTRVGQLEAAIEKMANQSSECIKLREQLSHVLRELKDTQGQLLHLDIELSAAKDAKFESMTKVEAMENSLSLEKIKTEELLRHVGELNEIIMHLQMIAAEQEKEKSAIITEKEVQIELAEAAASEAREQLQFATEQLEMMQYLENQLLDKYEYTDILQKDLHRANSLHKSSEKVVFDALNELNQLKENLELKEQKNSDQAACISSLETELQELKLEICRANEEKDMLIMNAEEMKVEIENTRSEITEARDKENAAEIEIAVLKSEIHKGRSKVVAAEAAEERAKVEKSAVYAALQQLAIEAEEAKNERRNLKATISVAESNSSLPADIPDQSSWQSSEASDIKSNSSNEEAENKDFDAQVTISKAEYDILLLKAEQAGKVLNPSQESILESDKLKKELEIAASKIAEFRARAEQAISRAEVAERGKLELEEQIKKWKEHKVKRKAALAALHEASVSKEIVEASGSKDGNSYLYNSEPKVYQPLSKMLNMKF